MFAKIGEFQMVARFSAASVFDLTGRESLQPRNTRHTCALRKRSNAEKEVLVSRKIGKVPAST